jgi:hypothetical protein
VSPVRTSASAYLLTAIASGALGIPGHCYAQVQLPTVNLSLTNCEDGFASPGWFLQELAWAPESRSFQATLVGSTSTATRRLMCAIVLKDLM